MFTGIITDIGTIIAAGRDGDLRLRIACGYDMDDVDLGASIACSGVCLTVIDKAPARDGAPGWFAVDVSAESVARTAPGMWGEGARLNLERAMRLGDELGGHIVTGHVDGIGTVIGVEPSGGSHVVTVAAPAALAPYIAPKGSITLDGVSLTVNGVADQPDGAVQFTLNIIPHTWDVTTLGALTPGRAVNLEIDVLARYLSRMEAVLARRG
ncbi:riboflavin synthase [Sphingomonas changnyeongensis]|uniref:Riboflavin synthase n=1 Tax=Sphingomonas changnyeongensis TaxID=2698679 RepID=A0A7Z2S5Q1_9SPHN|nr:riboflavin synthase [Sphingomonas changnyeongensis]QHL90598.1 riboflavin synthase [Sphingomonas changnyeongensis]